MQPLGRFACLSVVMLVLLAACDGDDNGAQNGAENGTQTEQPGPAPETPNPKEERRVDEGESVVAGRHVVATFQPRFSFRFQGKQPWRAARQTERLLIWDAEGGNQIVFARPDRVYLFEEGNIRVGPTPTDLHAWLENNPHVKVTARSSASVGAREGEVLDILVTSVVESVRGCPIPCLPLVPLEIADKSFFLADQQKARFIFLDADGEQMFVGITSSPRDFKAFAQKADRFLKTVQF